MTKPTGILGGTFDPIHNGHLNLALECQRTLDLAEVRLIPVRIPPHRSQPVANAKQRLAMLRLAVQDQKHLLIDKRELQREGDSYTIDTLKTLRGELGSQALCIIMGLDAFQTFNTWRHWQLILDYAHIILANRPGSESTFKEKEVAALFDEHTITDVSALHKTAAGHILKMDVPMLDISATQIRHLIATRGKVEHLLSPPVIKYIEENRLYNAENE